MNCFRGSRVENTTVQTDVLLAVSGFQMYRSGRNCRRRSRLSLVLFGLSAAIVLGVMVFPQTLAELMATREAERG